MRQQQLLECYSRHHRRLYLVALAVTMNREQAEDAVHDAFERLLRKRVRPESLLPYVMRAVRNAAIDCMRRRGRETTDPDILIQVRDVPCDITPRTLSRAMSELSLDERETIWLHIYAGLSFSEIAAVRRRSSNTVASWYRRGIARLRKMLEVNDA